MTISNFINHELKASIEEIFRDINAYIFEKESVDLRHIYIDGTKITANANRYTWVWKKSCETSRKKVFVKVSEVLEAMNHSGIELQGVTFGQREEYAIAASYKFGISVFGVHIAGIRKDHGTGT